LPFTAATPNPLLSTCIDAVSFQESGEVAEAGLTGIMRSGMSRVRMRRGAAFLLMFCPLYMVGWVCFKGVFVKVP
jgi:hypothetical protein